MRVDGVAGMRDAAGSLVVLPDIVEDIGNGGIPFSGDKRGVSNTVVVSSVEGKSSCIDVGVGSTSPFAGLLRTRAVGAGNGNVESMEAGLRG